MALLSDRVDTTFRDVRLLSFFCTVIFCLVVGILPSAAEDAVDQGTASAPLSAVDAGIEAMKKRSQRVYYQPEDASPPVAGSSAYGSNMDDAIRSDVFRLYSEKLVKTAPPSAAPAQNILAPQPVAVTPVVAAAPILSAPAAAPEPVPAPFAPTPIATPVLAPTTPAIEAAAMPVAPPAAPAPDAPSPAVVAPTQQAVMSAAPSPPLLPTSSSVSVANTSVTATPQPPPMDSTLQPAPAPVYSVAPRSFAPPPAPPAPAVAQPSAGYVVNASMNPAPSGSPNDLMGEDGLEPGHPSDFLRRLAGADGIPLNVVDAVAPADVQTPVHLNEAVAFALENNFEVKAAREKTRGAYWDKMGAYSEYLPNVALSADTGPERSAPASINDANGNRVLDNTHNRRDRGISITQPLIDLSIISDILSGKDKEQLADTDQGDVHEGIAFDTVSVYLSLLQSRIAIRLSDNYKGYLDDLAQRMQARVDGGGAPSADLDRIRGRETIAESARIEALGEYQSNLAEFKRLTKIMPAQLVIPSVLAPAVPDTMQDAMERALKFNPTYVSSLKKIDLAEDDRNKSFAGLLPKLSAQYNNSYSFNAGGAAEGNPVDGVYPVQKTQSVMLVAQWSLNGGTSVAGGLSGMAKEREMSLRSLDVRARLEQGIQAGYTAINAAHQREAVLNKGVQANARVVASFDAQYKMGGRSLFDLLDSYEQLYNARLNLMRVVIAEAKASYQVRRQMGELRQSILASEAP